MVIEEHNYIMQDYLRAIWHLEQKEGIASNNALSKELNVTNGTVSEMMGKLTKQNLVNYTPYQGAVLSLKGKKIALEITRRHKLWEVFLEKKLDFNWDEVHELAHLFEHINSEKLIQRLDNFLGNPTHDPHGDIIPLSNALPRKNVSKRLTEFSKNMEVRILRVDDENPELLKHFIMLGLSLNCKIKIIDFIEFDNSIKIKLKSNLIIISQKLAECIYVANVSQH